MGERAERNNLKRYIETVTFCMLDTGLFLDTHMHCKEALKKYKEYSDMRNQALVEYKKMFGTPNMTDPTEKDVWDWVEEPWPWEEEE